MLLNLMKVKGRLNAKKTDRMVHWQLKIAGPFETLIFCILWLDNPSPEQQNTVKSDRNVLRNYPADCS